MKNFRNGQLMKNTVMLYILQFSQYFFSLMTVPYQTRILGNVTYGQIGWAVSIMAYFQLFMDFGFMLSATEDISKNRNDKDYINRRITSIFYLKIILAVISAVITAVLCCTVAKFRENTMLFLIYIAAYIVNSFIPDYLYRGIERMTSITVRTVIIKFFFAVMIFVLLKSPADILIIPILLLIGNLGAVIASYVHVFKKLGYSFTKVSSEDLKKDFKRSWFFFLSRIATTIYSSTNTVILGFVDTQGVMTSCYSSADKVFTTAKSGLSPISDSLYPYMVEKKDYRMVKLILAVLMPVIILGCIVVGIFAEPLCVFAFGEGFEGTAPILTALLPAIAVILPNYILGFPTLSAMGKANLANTSVIVGSVCHLIGIAILLLTHNISGVTLAAMASVTECIIFSFRLIILIKNRKLLGGKQ